MHRPFLLISFILAALAVVLGAFGAHALKQTLSAESLGAFETGVRYQFYHCFALMVTGIIYENYRNIWIRFAGYAFVAGVLLFSGSLYLLVWLKTTPSTGLSGVGIVTPIGGLCLIAGWIFLLSGLMIRRSSALKSI
ncbi:MAG TPA: DUF423 domain-containing protein [Flavitalea sp.]|nr:DUF423 domain-containing protein [Flavitalea sp.]